MVTGESPQQDADMWLKSYPLTIVALQEYLEELNAVQLNDV